MRAHTVTLRHHVSALAGWARLTRAETRNGSLLPARSRFGRHAAQPPPLLSPLPHAASAAPKALAFLAAASILLAGPHAADAKVVFAKSDAKKVFQGEVSKPREKAPAAAKEKKSGGGFITPSIGPSAGVLALPGKSDERERHAPETHAKPRGFLISSLLFFSPGAILGIAGAAALATSVDSKFGDFIDKATLRDCNNYAGYEPALKGEGGPPARAAPKAIKKSGLFKKK